MIRLFVYIFLIVSFSVSAAQARLAKQHAKSRVRVQKSVHFPKNGVFIWNELCFDGNNFRPYVEKARANGVKFVVIKASDGGVWGVRNGVIRKSWF